MSLIYCFDPDASDGLKLQESVGEMETLIHLFISCISLC